MIAASAHAEHDAANAATGFRFVRAIAVEKAVLDRTLKPAGPRVLAAISYFMNDKTKRAWPSYRAIAELTGYSEDTIDRAIRELKSAGYLFAERKAPPNGGRALVHYGLGTIHPQHIEEMISAVVDELRRHERGEADPGEKSGVRHGPTPPKMSGSDANPAVFVPSDPAVLSPQEPLVDEPLSEVLAEHSQARAAAPDKTQPFDSEVSRAKRKGRSTGKRLWEWVHDGEKLALLDQCKHYAAERAHLGWTADFLAERLRAFAAWQSSRRTVSADWWAELELWLGNAAHQPRASRGRASIDDLAAQAFGGDPWARS